MSSTLLRKIFTRAAVVLPTLTVAITIALAHWIHLNRQALFVNSAYMGHLSLMRAFYSLGVDVNSPGCNYHSCFTPLWGAAYGGYDNEIRFLIERGADVNGKTNWGATPLMVSAYKGHVSTTAILLSYGADPNANWEGDTALSIAREKGHPEVVELLREAGVREAP